jgi:hypothetical protein
LLDFRKIWDKKEARWSGLQGQDRRGTHRLGVVALYILPRKYLKTNQKQLVLLHQCITELDTVVSLCLMVIGAHSLSNTPQTADWKKHTLSDIFSMSSAWNLALAVQT